MSLDSPIEQLIMDNIIAALQAMGPSAYTYALATVSEVKANVPDLSELTKPAVLVTTEEIIPFIHAGDVQSLNISAPLGEILVYRDMPVTLTFALTATPTDETDPSSIDRPKEARLMLADLYKCVMALDHQDVNGSPIDIRATGSQQVLTDIESPLVYGGLRFLVRFQHRYGDMTRA